MFLATISTVASWPELYARCVREITTQRALLLLVPLRVEIHFLISSALQRFLNVTGAALHQSLQGSRHTATATAAVSPSRAHPNVRTPGWEAAVDDVAQTVVLMSLLLSLRRGAWLLQVSAGWNSFCL